MLKKISIGFVIMALFFVFSSTFSVARAEEANIDIKADLGIENVGTLPTSPWYFFKEIRRGIKKFFTFNPVKKAKIELEIANEKAAEAVILKKMKEQKLEEKIEDESDELEFELEDIEELDLEEEVKPEVSPTSPQTSINQDLEAIEIDLPELEDLNLGDLNY